MAIETHSVGLSDSLVILGAAGLVIPTFARLRISPIIGFILVGVLVGPAGLGAYVDRFPWLYHFTITEPESIAPFAELGIILLLFTIGLELSFRRLWTMRSQVFGLGAIELIASAALIGGGLYLIGQNGLGALGLGLALALSSTALVMQMAGTASPVGRTAFAMLLFEDLALVPIIFVLGALAPNAPGSGWDNLFATVLWGSLTVAAMLVLGRLLLPPLFAQAARTKSPELFLAASLLVAIAAAIATTAVGLSPIVGALIAGVLIAETNYRNEVEIITAPFKGLALGVFLITVGMSIDLRAVIAEWPELLAAVVGVVAIKTLVTWAMLRSAGFGAGVSAEAGLLLASPSETTLIVLAVATTAGLIGLETAAFWQTVTAIGLTITPMLAKLGRVVARRADLQSGSLPDEAPDEKLPRAVIIGFGRVGRLVAEMLQTHGRPYLAVDGDIDTVAQCRREGFKILFGDAARPELLDRLKLDQAGALILTMDDPVLLVRLTRKVRAAYPDLTIVARARDPGHAAELYRAGVTDAVPETLESSLQLSEAALVDLGIAMGPVIASIHEKRAEFREEIMKLGKAEREPPLHRRRLRDALRPR
jgi:CPA2 family monovalent cation:H+ antiporter-2